MQKRILWLSRHDPTESQVEELKRIYGNDVLIEKDPRPFSSAEDIVLRFKNGKYDDLVVIAPLSVLGRLCELGIKPLWADMEVVPDEEAEVIASGRGYRFIRFKRIKRLKLEFEEVLDGSCVS